MTALLDSATADKLVKALGLLGSNHDGERAAAALKADKLVKAHGLRWSDIVSTSPASVTWSSTIGKIRFALAHIDLLSRWEHGFLLGVRKRRNLSPKQQAVLDEICDRLREGGAQ